MLFARSHIEIVDWKLSKRSSRLFLKNERTVFEMAPREIIGIGSKVTIVEGKIGDGKWRSRFYIRREVSRIRGKKRETSDVSTNKKRKKERRKKKSGEICYAEVIRLSVLLRFSPTFRSEKIHKVERRKYSPRILSSFLRFQSNTYISCLLYNLASRR